MTPRESGLKQEIEKEITDCCKDRFTIKMKKLDSSYSCSTCDALERVLTALEKTIAEIEILIGEFIKTNDLRFLSDIKKALDSEEG